MSARWWAAGASFWPKALPVLNSLCSRGRRFAAVVPIYDVIVDLYVWRSACANDSATFVLCSVRWMEPRRRRSL